MKKNVKKQRKTAFTIVELLTVMGVIAILIGLLVPALNLVRRIAKDTRQRAQFHSITVALGMFQNDAGDYPASAEISAGGTYVEGSQRLAEALVGRDLQGFDPVSNWHPALDTTNNAYSPSTAGTPSEQQKSLDRRKGPYLTLENVGAFNIDQLYPSGYSASAMRIHGTTTTNPTTNDPAPFITDVFTDRSITLTSGTTTKTVKAGTPVLYYRANPANKNLGKNSGAALNLRTYNYDDNQAIMAMGRMMNDDPTNATHAHRLYETTTYSRFYDVITNPQIASTEGVAYNANSFILMSAGKDGFFGTADDIYNFGE